MPMGPAFSGLVVVGTLAMYELFSGRPADRGSLGEAVSLPQRLMTNAAHGGNRIGFRTTNLHTAARCGG